MSESGLKKHEIHDIFTNWDFGTSTFHQKTIQPTKEEIFWRIWNNNVKIQR